MFNRHSQHEDDDLKSAQMLVASGSYEGVSQHLSEEIVPYQRERRSNNCENTSDNANSGMPNARKSPTHSSKKRSKARKESKSSTLKHHQQQAAETVAT